MCTWFVNLIGSCVGGEQLSANVMEVLLQRMQYFSKRSAFLLRNFRQLRTASLSRRSIPQVGIWLVRCSDVYFSKLPSFLRSDNLPVFPHSLAFADVNILYSISVRVTVAMRKRLFIVLVYRPTVYTAGRDLIAHFIMNQLCCSVA